jgi:hypothetical protein
MPQRHSQKGLEHGPVVSSVAAAVPTAAAALAAICLAALLGGCDSIVEATGEETGPALDFSVETATRTLDTGAVRVGEIDDGQYGDIIEGTRVVLRDEKTYASFWKRLHAGRRSAPDRPAVDFETHAVVAVVLGERLTGGHSVRIDGARSTEDREKLQVRFTESVPGDGCVTTQVLTSPYVLATVGARSEDVTFDGDEETRSC